MNSGHGCLVVAKRYARSDMSLGRSLNPRVPRERVRTYSVWDIKDEVVISSHHAGADSQLAHSVDDSHCMPVQEKGIEFWDTANTQNISPQQLEISGLPHHALVPTLPA
jgi:hypothetical protein